ncbi:hypothetical protein N7478_011027 [Penicillium angulare]|uniref:uncharacterized protein n=1 Tax=Penicillium angulare TaxID=116970 RepID=UPI002541541D|nr:uncharacterized protein N7478_011027 [Penicillium angulare]KAJ5263422.1 hypothetical protein N7478_011027 [Penicillium angulare]
MSQILHKAESAITSHKNEAKDHNADQGGSHGSKLANNLDPRLHTSHGHYESETPRSAVSDNAGAAEGSDKSYPEDVMTDGIVGAHHDDSDVSKEIEQRAVPEDKNHHDELQEAKSWRPTKQDRLVGH